MNQVMELPPGLTHYLSLGAMLFVLGIVGFLTRRNMILMFLNAELMIQGVALNFVAFARHRGNLEGQGFVLFLLAVAACEAAIALALIMVLYRTQHSLDVSVWQNLREDGLDPVLDEEPLLPCPIEDKGPTLTVAGPGPQQPEETSHV